MDIKFQPTNIETCLKGIRSTAKMYIVLHKDIQLNPGFIKKSSLWLSDSWTNLTSNDSNVTGAIGLSNSVIVVSVVFIIAASHRRTNLHSQIL